MPDYNRRAKLYWWAMALLGAVALAHAARTVAAMPGAALTQVVAGVSIAMIAGFFPVHVPRSKNSFAAGEIFIFLLLLLHGPAAATLAAAGEGMVGAFRTSKRWTSRIATPAMASLAIFGVGSLLQQALEISQLGKVYGTGFLLLATMLCSILYFALNTVLIAAIPYLKRKQWPVWKDLFGNFGWIGVTYAGSASIACLLFLTFEQAGIGVLMAAAPIIAMLLTTLHYVFRQQEADEIVRRSRLEAVEREAALASHHMRELAISERRFHSAFTHASIGMALVASDARILQVNAAWRTLLGLDETASTEQMLFNDFVDERDEPALNDRLMQLNSQRVSSFTVELRLRHCRGLEVLAEVHGSFFTEADAAAPSLILQVQDITARRQAEAGLQHIAFHDSLTGLPNRRAFHELLAGALGLVRLDPRRQFGVMFLDFDRFKLINDSLGHAVGDEFLVAVSRCIPQYVRPDDIVARLGGDEFAILAWDLQSERFAETLAERLLIALGKPMKIAGNELNTSASIGITFSANGYVAPEDMLRDADTAMYKAKAAGKARYALFDKALHKEVAHRLRLEGDLRRALAAGELNVAYQPLIDLSNGRVIGFEALSRWDHPEFGAVSPGTFIEIAEESGLITQLTDLVLHKACRQLKEWQGSDAVFAELTMHVNISGNDIAHPSLVQRVGAALAEAKLAPRHLTLELTENILMAHLEAALPRLFELRRSGIGLSVDDFGTGYSSLQHLSMLPVDSLKIDRGFVANLHRDSNEAAIVRAIIQLGKSLGKSIIAEGIENAEQMEQLRLMGCTSGQGFHMSRPIVADLVDTMLAELAPREPGSAEAGTEDLVYH